MCLLVACVLNRDDVPCGDGYDWLRVGRLAEHLEYLLNLNSQRIESLSLGFVHEEIFMVLGVDLFFVLLVAREGCCAVESSFR